MSLRKSKKNYHILLGVFLTCVFLHLSTFEIKFVLQLFKSALKEKRPMNTSLSKIPEEKICRIPYIAPYGPLMKKKHHKEVPEVRCKPADWVRCTLNACVCNMKTSIYKNVSCQYSDIIYVTDDESTIGPPKSAHGELPHYLVQSDFVKVRCRGTNAEGVVRKWRGNLAGIRQVPAPKSNIKTEGKPYSIVLYIFDSTSRNSFVRKMPLSYKVLKNKLNAIVMNGYNIVGSGTSHALVPILTGHNLNELPDVRRNAGDDEVHSPDELPLIWNLLRNAGYKTAYWEDSPMIGTFNRYYYGFRNQPTDHYLRPYLMEYYREGLARKYCAGGMPVYRLLINLTAQLMQQQHRLNTLFHANHTYFALTFSSDLSHNSVAMLSAADRRFSMFLRAMRSHGALEDTVFVVMGDHGNRFSSLRRTRRGKQEERLPFLSFVLPPSLQASRPEVVRAIRSNADRLTTPYDLHSTLLELAGLGRFKVNVTLPGFRGRRRALSLLKPIPPTRSCGEAGINEHWCTCLEWKRVKKTDPMFGRSVHTVLLHINDQIRDYRHLCVERKLWAINWVLSTRTQDGPNDPLSTHYQVKVVLQPAASIYEASLKYDEVNDRLSVRTEDISRVNRYRDEPHCIIKKKPDLRNFCYCYDQQRNMTDQV